MILLFPWAQTFSGAALAAAAHSAARTSTVPITLHLDHAQSASAIHAAADTGCYDSIMVDMSHHSKTENLRLTTELTTYCHERGIVTEAEPGRITGGEDGVMDTKELEAIMTTVDEAREFAATGIDWLAPAFGNVHGNYGSRGIQLEYERLKDVHAAVGEGVRLVLHGTDGFDEGIYGKCVERGRGANGCAHQAWTSQPPASVGDNRTAGCDPPNVVSAVRLSLTFLWAPQDGGHGGAAAGGAGHCGEQRGPKQEQRGGGHARGRVGRNVQPQHQGRLPLLPGMPPDWSTWSCRVQSTVVVARLHVHGSKT